MAIPVFTQDQINRPVEIGKVSDLLSTKSVTESGKYNVDQYSYPIDLVNSEEYGGNMVVFYINVNKESKFAKQNPQAFDMSGYDIPRIRGSALTQNQSSAEMATTGLAGGLGFGTLLGLLGGASIATATTGLNALGGIGLYAAGETAGTTTRAQKRLKTAISLHMPNALTVKYSAGWAEEEMMSAEMFAQVGQDISGITKAMGDLNLSNMTSMDGIKGEFGKSTELKQLGSMGIAQAIMNAPGGSYAGVKTGLAPNPRKEMVFKGVDFRSFTFDYSFFPRSEEEARSVLNIIQQFKYHMHPEFQDQSNFLYIYPSEFDIEYHNRSGENKFIHKHSSCVLTEFNINYTPNSNFTTFANGMPTQISISMSFKELDTPSKESIARGL